MGRFKKAKSNETTSSKQLPIPRSPEEENEEPAENGVKQLRKRTIKGLDKVEKKKTVKHTRVSMVKQEVKEKLKVQFQPKAKVIDTNKISNQRGKKNIKKAKVNKNKVLVENSSVNTTDEEQILDTDEKSASLVSNGNVNLLSAATDENQNESKDAKENDEINLKAAKKLKAKTKKTPKKVITTDRVKRNSTVELKKKLHNRVASPISQYNINKDNNLICRICFQVLDDNLKFYSGILESDEVMDDSQVISKIEEDEVLKEEDRNYYKLTSFSIFCKNGHICPFDSVLFSEKEDILISGCLKPIRHNFASLNNADSLQNLGPIIDWWVTEYNGKDAIVCSTKNEDFILSEPSKEYAAYMESANVSLFIAKKIVEYLTISPTTVYQELLGKLERIQMLKDEPSFFEDMLLYQAPFIIRQLMLFDQTARPHESFLTVAPCIRHLINLTGIKPNAIKLPKENPRRNKQINAHREKLLSNTAIKKRRETQKALTELANNPFLLEQKLAGLSGRRCGICENCQRPACNACLTCERREPDRCFLRRCLFQEIQEANEVDAMFASELSPLFPSAKVKLSLTAYADALGKLSCCASSFSWLGEPVAHEEDGSTYYESMLLNGEEIRAGDFVLAGAAVLRISYLWRDETGTARLHAAHLWRASDSPLGALGEHRELLHTPKCCELPVTCVLAKLPVTVKRTMPNWEKRLWSETTAEGYYCQRSFDPESGRFEDLPPEDVDSPAQQKQLHRFCANCDRADIEARRNMPYPYEQIEELEDDVKKFGAVKYRDEVYRIGSCVYLKPRTLYFKYPMLLNNVKTRGESIKYIDEEKYPEYYRKIEEEKNKANTQLDMASLFDVGYITEIFIHADKLFIKVKKMYRPENTHKRETFIRQADFNILFWSNEEYSVSFNYVVGKCFLSHLKNVKVDIDKWTLQGPDRFYFSQIYENKEFYNVDRKDYRCKTEVYDVPKVYPKLNLRTLNIFAGCGGLSLGLRQAGVAKICWAVEPDSAAALTFKLNNFDTIVFNEECSELLKKFVGGEKMIQNQRLPLRGEVDLLCASLPFEIVTDVTTFINSGFATFITYCEVYRPTYFILETEEMLVKKNILFKLTIACLLSMGYQVSFDVLQVGCFGVPQNQKKLIILGAAPGRKLPKSPKPIHIFPKVYCSSGVVIDNKKYIQNIESKDAAPYRAVTVRDALSDLPHITAENCKEVISYNGQITSYFQKMMRLNMSWATVFNHVCKNLGPLVQARISQIPLAVGSDWRNLPNIEMKLRDGTITKKLIYKYDDVEAGPNSLCSLRGVCACSMGEKCNPRDRQENTLLPWHLVHSAKQNSHWAGLYSRLQWAGFFHGMIKNPELLNEQGPVIHPDQHRVVSVRECARAQGFPDDFMIPEDIQILDKYRIIGSATSPRLAFALGCEIARSLARKS